MLNMLSALIRYVCGYPTVPVYKVSELIALFFRDLRVVRFLLNSYSNKMVTT